MVIGVAVFMIVLIGGGVAWWMMAKPTPAPVPVTPPVLTEAPAKQLILATRDVNAPESGSDSGDREFWYKLMSVNTKTLAEKSLGSLRNNIFVTPFALWEGRAFFVNPEGELASYTLETEKDTVVKIPGVEPVFGFFDEHSMWDFEVSGSTLVYLRGMCAEGSRCDLYQYDLVAFTNTLILPNLQKLMKMDETSGLSLQSYDPVKNLVVVKKAGSDGAYSYTELFDVSLAEKKIVASKKMADISDNAAVQLTCDSAEAVQKYERFQLPGGEYATENQTTITSQGLKKSYHPTYIVGCL